MSKTFGDALVNSAVNSALDAQKSHKRINEIEKEGLEYTNLALRNLNEANEVGTQAASELNRQGNQLRGIEQNLDNMNNDLNETEKCLTQIEKGSILDDIKSFFSFSSSSSSSSSKTPKVPSSQPNNKPKPPSSSSKPSEQLSAQGYVSNTDLSCEEKIHQNLDEMFKGLSKLDNLSDDMSAELNRQKPLIENLDGKVMKLTDRMDDQNKKMKKINKS